MNGLGDMIEVFTEVTGIKTVAEAVAKLAGLPGCGCKERKQYLNLLFPFDGYSRQFTVLGDFMTPMREYKTGEVITVKKNDDLFGNVIFLVQAGKLKEND